MDAPVTFSTSKYGMDFSDSTKTLGFNRPSDNLPRHTYRLTLRVNAKTEQEDDGRWIAEVLDLPGVLAYGSTEEQAKENALLLALHVVVERFENKEIVPGRVLNITPAL